MSKIAIVLAFSSMLIASDNEEIARNRASQRTTDYTSKKSQGEKLLIILNAKDGHIGKDSSEQYFLTLYGVGKNVTYFSEGPNRRAGKVNTDQFLERWAQGKNSFKRVKPNAGVVIFNQTLGPHRFSEFPVILSNPKYEKESNRLTFDIRDLETDEMIPTGDLGEVTLFIDDLEFKEMYFNEHGFSW